jgi:hypothetical protein
MPRKTWDGPLPSRAGGHKSSPSVECMEGHSNVLGQRVDAAAFNRLSKSRVVVVSPSRGNVFSTL